MPFDLSIWRDEMRGFMTDFARDPKGAMQQTGVQSLYGFLLGSTLFPIVAAYATDPGTAIVVLTSVLGGIGTNLVSNLVQQRYDAENVIMVAAQEAQRPELALAYEALAKQLNVFPEAERALAAAGQQEIVQQLRDELRQLGKAGQFAGATITIEQSGGVNRGVGNTIGSIGTITGGDSIDARSSQGFINTPSGPVKQTFGEQRNTSPDDESDRRSERTP